MSLGALLKAIKDDKVYETELKGLANAAVAAGSDPSTKEWAALVAKVYSRIENPSKLRPLGCMTFTCTVTSAECFATTTTTTWLD